MKYICPECGGGDFRYVYKMVFQCCKCKSIVWLPEALSRKCLASKDFEDKLYDESWIQQPREIIVESEKR